MFKKINWVGIFLILIITVLLFCVGFKRVNNLSPTQVYQVYLEGNKIGVIKDENELFNLIDETQQEIKQEYKVDKVYPPDNLETVPCLTYNNEVASPSEIYKKIEEKSNFTIKGYKVTIKGEEKDPIYINILNKEDLELALKSAVSAFISSDKLDSYINNTQIELTDTGETIKNVYFEETITIKESYLNVDELILTNEKDLTQYLLFGTNEKQKSYIVKDGDTVETVAYNNQLSTEELLIANNALSSTSSLLSEGQELNIGLINPLFTVIEEVELVEDIKVNYDTKYEYDSSMASGESYTKQDGIDGKSRVTEQIQYKNGEIMALVISNTTELTAAVDKIVVKGTKKNSYGTNYEAPDATGTDWAWPTTRPYVITSKYGYRWGRLHAGIDISGTGYGAPIYSATSGTVVSVNKSCANKGYYGSSCGGQLGNYVVIHSNTGYEIKYGHIKNNITVSVGQTVSQGQVIGYMGNSGSSTGTHLHFQINDLNGKSYNPCKVAFKC